jgi:2-polyprenyl-3-methyl-5-hydroxy-6-metoxy-1,4-benzoquinol methylase
MSKEFTFKAIDEEGQETLEVVAGADKFNQWMYDTIAPYCHGKILEVGSGIGNISSYFLNKGQDISLSDLRENYCQILRNNFKEFPSLNQVVQLDIVDENFDTKYAHLLESFDSIYALNIVEHVKDDTLAIANCKKLLKPGGHLVILVPSYQKLYNNFDIELEHYRRYTQKSLDKLFVANELKIIHRQYYNFVGILGWWFSGNVLKKKTIPGGQMKLYNSLVPIIKLVDKVLLQKAGLSVITVGKK